MGRFRRRMYEEYAHEFSTDESYNIAYRKVKRIKGFYSHLRVYIIVNIIIILTSLNSDSLVRGIDTHRLFELHTYSTALCWGVALAIHALSVFGRDIFFGEDWEQKKIQKYMEKETSNTNKWE